MDEELSQAVLAAAKTSMGMDCSAFDMANIVQVRPMFYMPALLSSGTGLIHLTWSICLPRP